MHLCSIVNQAEVDGLLGESAGPGNDSAPFVNGEVCQWRAGSATLTMRRFPSPEGGLAAALPGAELVTLPDGAAYTLDGGVLSVGVEDGRATIVLELSPGDDQDLDDLAELARSAAQGSP